jgi:hypothetical protein
LLFQENIFILTTFFIFYQVFLFYIIFLFHQKHASIENLNNAGRNKSNPIADSRSQSQYDVIADRRLQLDNAPPGRHQDENRPKFFETLDQYRALSANDTEALRQKSSFNRQPAFDNFRPLAPMTDNYNKAPENYRSPSFNNGKSIWYNNQIFFNKN